MFRPEERAKFESVPFFVAMAFRFPICRRFDPILAPCWLHCGAPGPHMASILWGVFGLSLGFMLVPKLALQQIILAYGLALGGLVGLREA